MCCFPTFLALELQANPPSTIQQLRQFIKSKFAVVIKPTEFISLTMDQLMPLLSELSPKSLIEYKSVWKAFVGSVVDSVGDIDYHTLAQTDIDTFKKEQTCSSVTLKKKLRLISSCLSKLGFKKELDFVIKVVKSDTTKRRSFKVDEVKPFLEATEKHTNWKFYLPRMALLTGCRLNELCQLRKSDFQTKYHLQFRLQILR